MPTVPGAVSGLVMIGATVIGATVMVSVEVVEPLALVAVRTTRYVPAVRGVPLIAPVSVLRVRPGGRPVTE